MNALPKYSFGAHIADRDNPLFDELLEQAYKIKERPRCLCKDSGVEMYIAKSGDNYILKRLPYSGQNHQPDCDSFEIPAELSGREAVLQKAIAEDEDTGLTSLKLDFSLSKISVNSAASKGEATEKMAVQANPTKLSIRSLLHFLYEDAGLNKWAPKMHGKRSWFIIRKYLLLAAQNKIARKNPLGEFLLIPENFSVDDKTEITSRRRQFLSKLIKKGNKQLMGILIGELKAIESARFGYKMLIKHMPDTPIYLDEAVFKRINKVFSTELAFFHENEAIHLLTICTFTLSATGSPQVDNISFMAVDRNWLPFENIEELELLERLCTKQRSFIKGLRYNLGSDEVIASVLMTDTGDKPTAVYLVPLGAKENYYNTLDLIVKESDLKSHVIDANKEQSLNIF